MMSTTDSGTWVLTPTEAEMQPSDLAIDPVTVGQGAPVLTDGDPAGVVPTCSGPATTDPEPGKRARWEWIALGALLVGTAALYMIGLGKSGWANAFYSAAVQAGTQSWKAMFFGSFDSSNLITVDKPPASLWVMEISGRIFGVNSWSILVPQALEGVAAVGLLYAAVRRWAGPIAGLLAGLTLAVTPIATLMFRFNNPDALLVLLLVVGAYCVVRAVERGSTWWLVFAATAVGFGFITKMLQAFLVVPAFALVYLIAANASLRRRLVQLVAAGAALFVSAGWWVAVVTMWPASSRPYIGGSQHNSVLELIFGYNGLGRVTGNETGSVGGGGGAGGTGQWGPTGWDRMFTTDWGGQIAWLLPTALALLIVLIVMTWRAPRTDKVRAAAILWGGWLVVTAVVFSFSQGIIHPYYSVALAPAIGALVGIGGVQLWKHHEQAVWRIVFAAIVVGTAVWAYQLLERAGDWNSWLRYLIVAGGLVAAAGILVADQIPRRLGIAAVSTAAVVALAAPTAFSLQTASVAHSGSLPTAGPSLTASFGGGPGGGRGFGGRCTYRRIPRALARTPERAVQRGGFGGVPAAGGGGAVEGCSTPAHRARRWCNYFRPMRRSTPGLRLRLGRNLRPVTSWRAVTRS